MLLQLSKKLDFTSVMLLEDKSISTIDLNCAHVGTWERFIPLHLTLTFSFMMQEHPLGQSVLSSFNLLCNPERLTCNMR